MPVTAIRRSSLASYTLNHLTLSIFWFFRFYLSVLKLHILEGAHQQVSQICADQLLKWPTERVPNIY